jgi:hypothetical protein
MAKIRRAFPTYRSRMDASESVLVSLCGDTGIWDNRHVVFADPGQAYDWTGLRRLQVAVIVRKGVDALPTVKALWDIAEPYIAICDADTGDEAAVLSLYPKLRLWPKRRDLEPLPAVNWRTSSDAEKSAYIRACFSGWGIR